MLDKEKIKTYFTEYLHNGYNKTKAYMKVHPDSDYNSARANCIRFHRDVIASESVKEFQDVLKDIIPESEIISAIAKEIKNTEQRKNGIDHWLDITGYTEPDKQKIEHLIPKDDQSLLDKYIHINRLQ